MQFHRYEAGSTFSTIPSNKNDNGSLLQFDFTINQHGLAYTDLLMVRRHDQNVPPSGTQHQWQQSRQIGELLNKDYGFFHTQKVVSPRPRAVNTSKQYSCS